MIVFLAITANYWGKGKTLSEAIKSLKKATENSPYVQYGRSKPFMLAIYEVKDFDEIGMNDLVDIVRGKNDKQLYLGEEKL